MPRSTLNSLTAALHWDDFMASSSGETNTSSVATTSLASSPIFSISSETLSQALSQALGQSLPQIIAAFQANGATSSSTSAAVQSFGGMAHASNVASSSIPSSSTTSGIVVVPSFISTYSTVGNPVFTALGQPPLMAISTPPTFVSPAWPAPGTLTFAPSVGKAFVVGPGYAPIPAKLVAKITSGIFVELADLLAENLRAIWAPHLFGWQIGCFSGAKASGGNNRYFNLGPGLYHLRLGVLQRPSKSLAGLNSVQITHHADGTPVPGSCLANVWCCIQEGCCGVMLGRLV